MLQYISLLQPLTRRNSSLADHQRGGEGGASARHHAAAPRVAPLQARQDRGRARDPRPRQARLRHVPRRGVMPPTPFGPCEIARRLPRPSDAATPLWDRPGRGIAKAAGAYLRGPVVGAARGQARARAAGGQGGEGDGGDRSINPTIN